jgi:hypothetical protein
MLIVFEIVAVAGGLGERIGAVYRFVTDIRRAEALNTST